MRPETLSILAWLVRDTFRQARASRLSWLLLGISALFVLICLGVRIDGGDPLVAPNDIELRPERGQIAFAFGAVQSPLFRDGEAAVVFVQMLLAEWVAGAGGTLLALLLTAGFVPAFLDRAAAPVLLAKPVSRTLLLAGKYLGVLAFVACQSAVFVGGTWLALGLATGYWPARYLWSIPLLVLQFAAVYSFSVLLAVCTRNTVVCAFGSILFWFLCWGMNFGRNLAVALPHLDASRAPLPALPGYLLEAGYWLLPKPADLALVLHQALGAGDHFVAFPEWAVLEQTGAFQPVLVVCSCLLFAGAILGVAARELADADY